MKRFLLIVSLLFGAFYQEYAIAAPEDDEEVSDDAEDVQNDDENEASGSNDDEDDDIDEEQRQRHIDNIVDNLVGADGNNVNRDRGATINKLMSENDRLKNEIKKLKKKISTGGKAVKIESDGDSEEEVSDEKPSRKTSKQNSGKATSENTSRKSDWKGARRNSWRAIKSKTPFETGPMKSFFTVKNWRYVKNVKPYVPNYSSARPSFNTSMSQDSSLNMYTVKSFATGERTPFESTSPVQTIKQNYFSKKDCNRKCH